MKTVFAVAYDDGKYRKKVGDIVPAELLARKGAWMLKTGLAKEVKPVKKVAE